MSFSQELIDKYAPEAECIQAMKIWKLPDGKEDMFPQLCIEGNYFAELKKDGYWYEFEKTKNHMYLFSRNISKNTGILTEKLANVPHIKKALEIVPEGTILIGEIYYPGKTSKDVTRVMGCLPEEAINRQKGNLVHFYLHDVIKYNGIDLQSYGALTRYKVLCKIWNKFNFNSYPFMELAEAVYDNIYDFTAQALKDGEEGAVLKLKTAPYAPDKRPAWSSIKIKKIDYLDAILIGFEDATKEYTGKEITSWPYWEKILNDGETIHTHVCQYGTIGWQPITKGYFYGWKTAIQIGAYDDNGNIVGIGTVSSGLTDESRADFAEHPEKYLNRVVSLQCMEKSIKDHTLRHAFFKNFRDDKNPKDCTLNTIF